MSAASTPHSVPDNLVMANTQFRLYGSDLGPVLAQADTLEEAAAIASRLNHYERKVRWIEEREVEYPYKVVARYTPTGKERK